MPFPFPPWRKFPRRRHLSFGRWLDQPPHKPRDLDGGGVPVEPNRPNNLTGGAAAELEFDD